MVIVIMGLALGLVSMRLGVIDFWRERSAFRKLTDTIVFLNNQAVMGLQGSRRGANLILLM